MSIRKHVYHRYNITWAKIYVLFKHVCVFVSYRFNIINFSTVVFSNIRRHELRLRPLQRRCGPTIGYIDDFVLTGMVSSTHCNLYLWCHLSVRYTYIRRWSLIMAVITLCPWKWQCATCCFASVPAFILLTFFISNVILGCYYGLLCD